MANSGTSSAPELLVELDRDSTRPLHRQLADGLRDAVRSGRLTPGARMPSTRVLSADLGVSRRMVVEAYSQLAAEGFLHSSQGGCTRGRRRRRRSFEPHPPRPRAAPLRHRLRPWLTRISRVSRVRPGCAPCDKAWPRSSPARSATWPRTDLPAARTAVADYLRRTRGVVADPRLIGVVLGRNASRRAPGPLPRRPGGDGGSGVLAASNGSAAQRYRSDAHPGGRQRRRRRRVDRKSRRPRC